MNLRKFRALLKPYNIQAEHGRVCFFEKSDYDDHDYKSDVITFNNLQAESCCGVEEIGDIDFSSKWKTLPQQVSNEIVNYLFPTSKQFQIIYSLECDKNWKMFNEALSATGWTPLKRWRGNGPNIIQAWCR